MNLGLTAQSGQPTEQFQRFAMQRCCSSTEHTSQSASQPSHSNQQVCPYLNGRFVQTAIKNASASLHMSPFSGLILPWLHLGWPAAAGWLDWGTGGCHCEQHRCQQLRGMGSSLWHPAPAAAGPAARGHSQQQQVGRQMSVKCITSEFIGGSQSGSGCCDLEPGLGAKLGAARPHLTTAGIGSGTAQAALGLRTQALRLHQSLQSCMNCKSCMRPCDAGVVSPACGSARHTQLLWEAHIDTYGGRNLV